MLQGIILSLGFLTVVTQVFGATEASEIYERHKKKIEVSSVFEVEGFLFASAHVRPRSESSAGLEGALKKARFQAQVNILDYAIAQVFDIESLSVSRSLYPALRSGLRKVFLSYSSLTTEGLEVVQERKERSHCTSILSLPVKQINELDMPENINWLDAIRKFAFDNGSGVDPFLLAELSNGDQLIRVIDYWLSFIEDKFESVGLRDTARGFPVQEIPSGMFGLKMLDEEPFTGLPIKEAFRYYPLFLNHPLYNRIMAGKALKEGYPHSALVFFYIGATYPVSTIDQNYCATSIGSTSLFDSLPSVSGLFPSFGISKADLSLLSCDETISRVILSEGGYKLKEDNKEPEDYYAGVNAFFSNPPDISVAEALFWEAVKDYPSANVCNMLGRCLSLKGDNQIAAIFLVQACVNDPFHPYAGANLALSLDSAGEVAEAIRMAKWALQNPRISEWGTSALEEFLISKNSK